MTLANLNLDFSGFSTAWNDLPENSKVALATLGFSTKIKNSIAGVKAGILGTSKTPWSLEDIEEEAKRIGLATFGPDEATAKAICDALQREMFEAIVSGIEPSSRRGGGPRLSDDDKLRRAIAIELLENGVRAENEKRKAKGETTLVEMPKRSKPDEKATFEALLAKALLAPKFAAAVEKEFNTRKKKAAQGVEGLDDLFA